MSDFNINNKLSTDESDDTLSDIQIINDIILSITNLIVVNIKEIKYYSINYILNLNSTCILLLLEGLSKIILSNINYSYKYSYYEPLVYLMVNIIINYKKKIDLEYNNKNIINTISIVNNCHKYLKKIKNIIEEDKLISFEILCNVALKGTFPGFLFWWEYYKNSIISISDYGNLLSNAIINPDDRLFKFIIDVKNIESISKFYSSNTELILIRLLQSNIPKKYKLKRIKLLSLKTDLSKYLSYMFKYSSLNILNTLMRYYYQVSIDFHNMKLIFNDTNLNFLEAFEFYRTLKTIDEKNIFSLLCNLNGFINNKIKIYSYNYKILDDNYLYIISKINQNIKLYINDENKHINLILKYYINMGYISKYLDQLNCITCELLKYSKFYVSNNVNSYNIKINKILHFLRCILKKKYRLKDEQFKFNFRPILNEIANFKPNLNIQVLKKGSTNYQLKEQTFNNIPPRHLLPLENINKPFLIKEKADGLLIKNIPFNIFPFYNEIFDYEVKSEFIEELNLYLIFDINIPDKTIYERQIILRNLHYITNDKLMIPNISNIKELKDALIEERNLLNTFICSNKEKIKWYPKGSWKININQDNYKELVQIITETSPYQHDILNGIFNCDGLILTPLDGTRELKIKPRSLQTIDLLFNGNKWIDSNSHKWSIQVDSSKNYKNKIYRCYPMINNKEVIYVPKEIRYDKKNPNSYQIIDQIQNIYKFDWEVNIEIQNRYYQEKKYITSNEIVTIIKRNENILYDLVNYIKPNNNKTWLDLGCGNCKLFKNIKSKYYPKKYLGIDNYIDILSELYYLVDENNNNFNIYPSNLDKIWDKNNIWNSFDWEIKYDYIVANFSLMHFCNNIFWSQLNNITIKGSIFIFNIVKPNSFWNNNKSYLKSNDNETEIYFEWVHQSPLKEKLITDDLINEYINEFNWKIIKTYQCYEPLSNCYKWFILEKIL
jgi:hypothetical protein